MATAIFRKLIGVETKRGIVHEMLECGHVLRFAEREYDRRSWNTRRRCWTCIYERGPGRAKRRGDEEKGR